MKKVIKFPARESLDICFFEKVVFIKEFHGLHDDLKSI